MILDYLGHPTRTPCTDCGETMYSFDRQFELEDDQLICLECALLFLPVCDECVDFLVKGHADGPEVVVRDINAEDEIEKPIALKRCHAECAALIYVEE